MVYLKMYFYMHIYFINQTSTCTQDSKVVHKNVLKHMPLLSLPLLQHTHICTQDSNFVHQNVLQHVPIFAKNTRTCVCVLYNRIW